MIKNMVDFILEDSVITEIDVKGDDIAVAAAYSQMLLYDIQQLISDTKKDEICNLLYSNQIGLKLKNKIDELKISIKQKFLIFYLLIGSTPRTSDWLASTLEIDEKITYDQFWQKFLNAGEAVIDRFLVDMFREIIEVQNDIECFVNEQLDTNKETNSNKKETEDESDAGIYAKILYYLDILSKREKPFNEIEDFIEVLNENDIDIEEIRNFIREICASDFVNCNEESANELLKDDAETYKLFSFFIMRFYEILLNDIDE